VPTVIDWVGIVKPNYLLVMPELLLLGVSLLVTILDLYMKEKRALVWVSLAGVVFTLASIFYVATDKVIAGAISAGTPVEAFGNMMIGDTFAFFMKGVVLFIAGMVILLSIDYVEKFLNGAFVEFYQILFAATLGMMLMVGSRDLITIYMGLELTSISSYILAGLLRKDPKSNEASLKYFLNGALASAVLLFGVSILFGLTGSTYLPEMAFKLGQYVQAGDAWVPLLVTAVIFVVVGFGFKVAAAPLHLWAPDTYEGSPTPVTGFFSVGPKAAAFAAILRIFVVGLGVGGLIESWSLLFAVFAVVSMFIGNLTALVQKNVKRMMAYSSIAQAGYILVGVAAAGDLASLGMGSSAVLFYLLAYALTNLGIFAVLTHMDMAGGWVEIKDFSGLAARNPIYAWALMLFFVSLIGIPPTVGFLGKFFLIQAAVTTGYIWLAVIMVINSVISVGYYYNIVRVMFLEKSDRAPLPFNPGVMSAVAISFIGVVLVTVLASPFIGFTEAAAALLK